MAKRKPDTAVPPDLSLPALSDTRPLFVDNREGNTLDQAIVKHLRALRREEQIVWQVCIASAFFNVPGFDLISGELDRVGKVRLLLGADPIPEARWPERTPFDPPPDDFTRHQVAKALDDLNAGLRRGRDKLPFDETTNRAVYRLLAILRSGKVEVRRYTRQFLHAKAFIFWVTGGGALVGSSNLTYAGLRANLELNLGQYQDEVVEKVENWFDELWEEAEPFDLAEIYDRLLGDYPPYLIYLKVLWELYGRELEAEMEESGTGDDIPITTFQKHGVWRAMRILKKFGGVLVADGVGLGKTYIAGEIIRQYRERRQRVLLVCPAALRDSTWDRFLHKYDFDRAVECVSYEELARDRQLGGGQDHPRNPIGEYALIVLDEAHNYRNPDAQSRAGVLRTLLLGQRRDVLMLSATPVNNSLWDLYHLLRYFIKQDAAFADHGILSLRDRFHQAMQVEPFNLNPDLLYPIIDATTVKRTRRFIKKHYDKDLIVIDGQPVPIKFPRPVASSIKYDLDQVLPGFFDDLEAALDPPGGHPRLTMARYQPDNYHVGNVTHAGDSALVGLLRTGLLKRFESSAYAFAKTTEKMIHEHDLFLQGLERGVIIRKELFHELSAADDDDAIDDLLAMNANVEEADDYDVEALRRDVENDRHVLAELNRRAAQVNAVEDPKLAALADELAKIAVQAEKEAIDTEDAHRKRKVLVFSAYTDTIDWIEGYLAQRLETDKRLRYYRSRYASVAGHESRGGVSRQAAVYGFAPESSGPPPAHQEDRFDMLLSTDVLAEGMNLQQCRNIINFDLPWNPMRLVQRHGRVDRIGSKHDKVFLRTYFPDKQLDRLLKLEARVLRKLAQAARSVGVEAAPIEDGAEGEQSFSESREEIEQLLEENPAIFEQGGTTGAAQSGEEYRQELRTALARYREELDALPWKAGSGMAKGNARGHFFLATVGGRYYTRFVPADGSKPIVNELGTCLRMIECQEATPLVMPADLKQTAFTAWQKARDDVFASWTRETDPANLQPRVSRFNREVAAALKDNPPLDVDQRRLERCLDAIESPWPKREEAQLRQVFNGEYESLEAKSAAVIARVEELEKSTALAASALAVTSISALSLPVTSRSAAIR